MTLKKISARFLLNLSVEELWDTLTGNFILVFDDGEIETNFRETLYSSYVWNFHRHYPDAPLLKKHHVQTVLAGNRLGSETHLELLGNAMWSVYDEYVGKGKPLSIMTFGKQGWKMPAKGAAVMGEIVAEPQFRDYLAEMVYRLNNEMYNDLSYRLSEYVVSLDVTDFIEVLRHPRVKAANEALQPNQKSIDDTYAVIESVLLSSDELPTNPIALASRSKLVNINQVLQCVGPRGYLTDTDSHLFRTPVMRGYAQGMRYLHDSLVESRSAAKSLIFSKTPLQQAEYFSRRLQLMSQIVQHLWLQDCGTTDYLLWHVRASDLKQLTGKYYLDEKTNALKTIHASDRHLVDKTLKIRSPLHCSCKDPYGICATCFGELSLSVPDGTNIGQMCCTSLAQKSSQNVLSVKHLDGSSVVEGIELTVEERKFLKAAPDDNSYMLSEKLKGKKVTLVIPPEKAANITDIMEVKNIEDLNITRVSELDELGMVVEDPAHPDAEPEKPVLDVSLNRRLSSMTYALLTYVRQHGWGVDERGNYTVDMKDWDWNQSILTLPLKHFNMSDHSKDIASMLESSVEKMQERDAQVAPDAALVELFDLVNKKLKVNLAVLEVVQLGQMIVSAERGLYEIPKPWTPSSLGIMKLSMAHRSAAAAMAFENHREFITSPLSFTEVNRPDHPFDAVLMPAEVQALKGWG
jgi:hypothetical protein